MSEKDGQGPILVSVPLTVLSTWMQTHSQEEFWPMNKRTYEQRNKRTKEGKILTNKWQNKRKLMKKQTGWQTNKRMNNERFTKLSLSNSTEVKNIRQRTRKYRISNVYRFNKVIRVIKGFRKPATLDFLVLTCIKYLYTIFQFRAFVFKLSHFFVSNTDFSFSRNPLKDDVICSMTV